MRRRQRTFEILKLVRASRKEFLSQPAGEQLSAEIGFAAWLFENIENTCFFFLNPFVSSSSVKGNPTFPLFREPPPPQVENNQQLIFGKSLERNLLLLQTD